MLEVATTPSPSPGPGNTSQKHFYEMKSLGAAELRGLPRAARPWPRAEPWGGCTRGQTQRGKSWLRPRLLPGTWAWAREAAISTSFFSSSQKVPIGLTQFSSNPFIVIFSINNFFFIILTLHLSTRSNLRDGAKFHCRNGLKQGFPNPG